MGAVRFRRDVVEFVLGPPEESSRWPCGCRAAEMTETDYTLVPCGEHRTEFDETP